MSKIEVGTIEGICIATGGEIKCSLIRQRGTLFLKSLNFTCRKGVFKGLWPGPSFLHFRPTIAAFQALPYWNQQPQKGLGVLELPYIACVIYVCFVCVSFLQTGHGQLPFAKITSHNVFFVYHLMG